jgi:SAM-dependent methyltransferase
MRRAGARALDRADRAVFPSGGPADEHWTRIVLNREISREIEALEPHRRTAVEISGDAHASRGWRSYEILAYPHFDVCAPLDPDHQRYDVVLCEQVLEHVVDPCAAVANLRRLCAPGGHVIVATPFLLRIHELPIYAMYDYWRFTPRGLRTLLEHAGLEVLKVDSWGNRGVVIGNFRDWARYRPWHSLRNEPDLPVQVWAVCRNPD